MTGATHAWGCRIMMATGAASGDLAYTYARSRYTFPGGTGAPDAVDTAYGKGISLWRREADGRWCATADIWNGAPQLPPILPAATR